MEMKKRDWYFFEMDVWPGATKENCFILLEHSILVSFPQWLHFAHTNSPPDINAPSKRDSISPNKLNQIDLDITSWEPIYHILTNISYDASLYLIRPPHRQDVRSSCAGVYRSMSCTLGLVDVQVNLVPIRSMGPWYVYLHLPLEKQLNVGKYAIHGSY